jgi:hypothetical protein
MKEGEIQSYCLEVLRTYGIFHMRLNSGVVKTRGAWVHLCPAGTADILTFPRERPPFWLEIKQLKGEQHAKQEEFQARVTALGHGYAVINSQMAMDAIVHKLR